MRRARGRRLFDRRADRDGAALAGECALRDLVDIEQEEHILPELLFGELVRCPPVMLGELLDGIEITLFWPAQSLLAVRRLSRSSVRPA
jgi:hypothetical protein